MPENLPTLPAKLARLSVFQERQLVPANGHLRWTINLSDVIDATADLPQEPREALLWLDEYGRINNLTTAEIGAKLIKPNGGCYSKDTVYQILTGRETIVDYFVQAVQSFRATLKAAPIVSPSEFPFVQTTVADSVWGYIELVRKWHKIGLIIGESQTGKSRSIREYARAHPEAKMIYHQIPAGGHKSKVVLQLCHLLKVSTKYNTPEREERIARAITPDMILVPDEIQQCASRLKAGGRMSAERVDTIEFYRWLRDTCGCSVLMVGTTEALQMLRGDGLGHESGGIFIQTLKRALDPYVLKNRPPARDLNAFAAHLKLKPAEGAALDLQNKTVVVRGLEIWLTYLLAGADIAAQQNRRVTWDDVLAGHRTFQSGDEK